MSAFISYSLVEITNDAGNKKFFPLISFFSPSQLFHGAYIYMNYMASSKFRIEMRKEKKTEKKYSIHIQPAMNCTDGGVCSLKFGIPQFGFTFQINKLYIHMVKQIDAVRLFFGEMKTETNTRNPL